MAVESPSDLPLAPTEEPSAGHFKVSDVPALLSNVASALSVMAALAVVLGGAVIYFYLKSIGQASFMLNAFNYSTLLLIVSALFFSMALAILAMLLSPYFFIWLIDDVMRLSAKRHPIDLAKRRAHAQVRDHWLNHQSVLSLGLVLACIVLWDDPSWAWAWAGVGLWLLALRHHGRPLLRLLADKPMAFKGLSLVLLTLFTWATYAALAFFLILVFVSLDFAHMASHFKMGLMLLFVLAHCVLIDSEYLNVVYRGDLAYFKHKFKYSLLSAFMVFLSVVFIVESFPFGLFSKMGLADDKTDPAYYLLDETAMQSSDLQLNLAHWQVAYIALQAADTDAAKVVRQAQGSADARPYILGYAALKLPDATILCAVEQRQTCMVLRSLAIKDVIQPAWLR
ncbi:MAG: hypothetical protein KBC57_02930 [Neisseriaceae bacterium]|nr:hypothetical protein [Neisseriaceae bacterium]